MNVRAEAEGCGAACPLRSHGRGVACPQGSSVPLRRSSGGWRSRSIFSAGISAARKSGDGWVPGASSMHPRQRLGWRPRQCYCRWRCCHRLWERGVPPRRPRRRQSWINRRKKVAADKKIMLRCMNLTWVLTEFRGSQSPLLMFTGRDHDDSPS